MKKLLFILFGLSLIVAAIGVKFYSHKPQKEKSGPQYRVVKHEDGTEECIMTIYGVEGNCEYDENGNVIKNPTPSDSIAQKVKS